MEHAMIEEEAVPKLDANIPFRWKKVRSRIRRARTTRRSLRAIGCLILVAAIMHTSAYWSAYGRIYLCLAQLCHWDQSHSDWNYTEFAGCNLSHLSFHKARMTDVTLTEADLSYSDLSEMYLFFVHAQGANFDGAKLCKADLEMCGLTGASFRNADLTDAHLGGNLKGADLHQANLHGCNVQNADFRGVSLEGVNLAGVHYGKDTRWPEGFRPQDHPEMVNADSIASTTESQ